MPNVDILKESQIIRSPRVIQLEGMFGIPAEKKTRVAWSANLPLEKQAWNIGLIVGPSGCGKTTLAGELFKNELVKNFEWFQKKLSSIRFPEKWESKRLLPCSLQ